MILRSPLFVPGNKANMLEKALGLRPDAFAPDMEDSVPHAEKANARATIRAIATLLGGLGATEIGRSGGGSDIDPSVREAAIPAMSTEVEGDYFRIHHTQADTVDKIDPVDMAKNAAAIAVMAYVIADMPVRLGN